MTKEHPFKNINDQLRSDLLKNRSLKPVIDTLNAQRLRALYQVSRELNTILDPDKLFREVIQKINELVKAERSVILLREGEDLKIRIAHNIDDQSERNAMHFSQRIVNTAMQEYRPVYSANAIEDDRFSQFQTIQQLEILSFICVPILVEERAIGTIYVDNRHIMHVFTEEDVDFLQAFANLLGIAIRNSLAYHAVEELNLSLERKVDERTSELRSAIEELKATQSQLVQSEKMASLGRLIAGFMHEFNNPINFIYSNLPHLQTYSNQVMGTLQKLLAQLPEEERIRIEEQQDLPFIFRDFEKLIEGIREGAERSRQIVEDLKNFSVSGNRQLNLINWEELLAYLTDIFLKHNADAPVIDINVAEPAFINGDRRDLNQALYNLLDNARRAGARHIWLRAYKEKGELVCTLKDDGCGISPENLTRIFDPFFTTREVGVGMGLGLSLVYNSIAHHGGTIDADSEVGKGTTFTIHLPLAKLENTTGGHPE